ncbi:unnamed protein product, partial [Linum tenue]
YFILLHSFLLLAQAITLSTCIVAHNNALLALLVSNNFSEIKSNVFKRFSKENIHNIVYAGEFLHYNHLHFDTFFCRTFYCLQSFKVISSILMGRHYSFSPFILCADYSSRMSLNPISCLKFKH